MPSKFGDDVTRGTILARTSRSITLLTVIRLEIGWYNWTDLLCQGPASLTVELLVLIYILNFAGNVVRSKDRQISYSSTTFCYHYIVMLYRLQNISFNLVIIAKVVFHIYVTTYSVKFWCTGYSTMLAIGRRIR